MIRVSLKVSDRLARTMLRVMHAEAVKVGRELVRARDDWEAAFRYHELVQNNVSLRIRDNACRLLEDLTDDARELLDVTRSLQRIVRKSEQKAVDDENQRFLEKMLDELGEGSP